MLISIWFYFQSTTNKIIKKKFIKKFISINFVDTNILFPSFRSVSFYRQKRLYWQHIVCGSRFKKEKQKKNINQRAWANHMFAKSLLFLFVLPSVSLIYSFIFSLFSCCCSILRFNYIRRGFFFFFDLRFLFIFIEFDWYDTIRQTECDNKKNDERIKTKKYYY